MSHKPLSQVGQRKNPFRLGSQVTPKAAQGTNVFDSMQRNSASKMKSPVFNEQKLKPEDADKTEETGMIFHVSYHVKYYQS